WNLTGLEDCHLPAARSLDLVRILQEGLTNVLKHSQASRVVIDLHRRGETLSLAIQDNGVGFDTVSEAPVPGTGLRSMRARAGRLGGTLDTRSRHGETVLALQVPAA
ncbi:ATP-binding protein, partial [Mesorhizobium sp. M7A.F.Ca.US.006.01.2.1]